MPYIKVATERDYPVNVYFEDYGEGKPVVLIHGWPLSHRMWEYQINALTEAGYRCVSRSTGAVSASRTSRGVVTTTTPCPTMSMRSSKL